MLNRRLLNLGNFDVNAVSGLPRNRLAKGILVVAGLSLFPRDTRIRKLGFTMREVLTRLPALSRTVGPSRRYMIYF